MPPTAARRLTVGLEVDICASFSVKLTVMVSPIPALPALEVPSALAEMIVGAVVLKSGAVLSIVTPDNVRLMVLLLPAASAAVTSSLSIVPEYTGTAGVPPDA